MVWGNYNDNLWFNRYYQKMKKLIFFTPIILLFLICGFFIIYLTSDKEPNIPPSALLDKDMPFFKSVSLYNSNQIINSKDLKDKKILINFFASWCVPCKIEHPLFFDLSENFSDLYILGINHKDPEQEAITYLANEGNPYNFVAVDKDGSIALEFGVFGLPETFLVNNNGKIIFKYMGPLTKEIINNEIKPLL